VSVDLDLERELEAAQRSRGTIAPPTVARDI
jgi:hypothetical protein